jgi:trehalose-6-phosphatase
MSDLLVNKKKTAVLFDLDGTLANLNGRSPYDQTLCGDDLIHEHIAEIARMYAKHSPHEVIIVSGRFVDCLDETVDWLCTHGILYRHLYMRNSKDQRPDTEIKAEIYHNKIEPDYDVVMVYDDRPKVIRMWRELGLNVADVGKGVEF